jgi:aminobenzoyl-glutamate utilization protein B
VIPDFAEVFYYVRHPDPRQVNEIFERVAKAAEGAALGTGTRVEHEIIHGIYAVLPNEPLARAMDANQRQVGGVQYDAKERAFAETLRKSLGDDAPPVGSAAEIAPFAFYRSGGSTDVADVSWVVPTAGVRTATWVPGTPSHSWQAVAAGGTTIGIKGMIVAAKTLALTAVDLFTKPSLIEEANAAYRKQLPPGWTYAPLVGSREPPLDYRKK